MPKSDTGRSDNATSDTENARRAAALLHHRSAALASGEPTALPLTTSSTFHLPPDDPDSFYYGRNDTPVWQSVEHQLAILEEAPCLLFASGMAAISAALFATLGQGKNLLIPADGYHATRRLAHDCLAAFGVNVRECRTRELAEATLDDTHVLFIETPSNPGLDVCDIGLIVERARQAGTIVIADNTASTPFLQRPLDMGVDIVVAADTKAPGGHSDVIAGHVASRNPVFIEGMKTWRSLGGAIAGPHQAWLLHRGLETLELRLERMCGTAGKLARALSRHERVHGLRYPGLPNDPSHDTAARQMSDFGTLISFELEGRDAANRFIERCSLLASATSFGGIHSSAERRARWGDNVAEGFIRLSVGCEPADVLIESIGDALNSM